MASLPVEVLFGIYLGVLTGIIPALISGVLGFLFKYVTNVTLPGFGVVVLGVALAGINGGLLALADPVILESANAATVLTGLLVVMMMSLYAHATGDQLGATLPRRLSLRKLGEQTLSADLANVVVGRNEIRIRVVGQVEDVPGYPPLPPELRESIRGSEWNLPADLQVSELETRLADRLRTTHDLADVTVEIDERGEATVAAAPPTSGLSRRVPSGKRAVSVAGLVPTGLARGDVVRAATDSGDVTGTVLSGRSKPSGADGTQPVPAADSEPAGEQTAGEAPPVVERAPTTAGGDGQVTLSVTRQSVKSLLAADRPPLYVEARGDGREYEVISLLQRAGRRFQRTTVRSGGRLDGATLSGLAAEDVAVLAVRHDGEWRFAPRATTTLSAGDELFAVGTSDGLAAVSEGAA